ncbi:MAG: haloalkane dehalogenase [Desulfobacterales bacterium]|nr:haloalkane dehalogenase [Desulfobacterales bacterium]
MPTRKISADFPFESKYVTVLGSKLHYLDEGAGDPILFLHGNPTSSYLWRNIIPHLAPLGRCIAPDLIGMGRSDKPRLGYRFYDHYEYVQGFIKALDLKNITLVIHDWGSALGFHYALRHANNIKGIAFMEAIIKPFTWEGFSKDFRLGFKLMRTPVIGWFMISVMNGFINKMLPETIVRTLSAAEKEHYAAPYRTITSRKPLRVWPCEIPIDGQPADVHAAVQAYNQQLQESDLPKLLLYARPGAIIDLKQVAWCRDHLKNLTVVDIGRGIHFIQEDNPHGIGTALVDWYQGLA